MESIRSFESMSEIEIETEQPNDEEWRELKNATRVNGRERFSHRLNVVKGGKFEWMSRSPKRRQSSDFEMFYKAKATKLDDEL